MQLLYYYIPPLGKWITYCGCCYILSDLKNENNSILFPQKTKQISTFFWKKHIQFVEKVQKTIDFQTKLFLKNIALFLEFLEHRSIPMISTYHHIKLVVLILDSKYHGHSLTNLDNTRHFTGPGTFSYT